MELYRIEITGHIYAMLEKMNPECSRYLCLNDMTPYVIPNEKMHLVLDDRRLSQYMHRGNLNKLKVGQRLYSVITANIYHYRKGMFLYDEGPLKHPQEHKIVNIQGEMVQLSKMEHVHFGNINFDRMEDLKQKEVPEVHQWLAFIDYGVAEEYLHRSRYYKFSSS